MAIWFCEMDIICPKQWDELAVTADPLVRDCAECGKPVHFIDSQAALEAAAAKGQCVAFLKREMDDLPHEKRQELHKISQRNSGTRRVTMGLPRRPMGGKLREFFDSSEAKKF